MVPNLSMMGGGLGDAIDQNDPCTQNPNDPICQAVNAGGNQLPGSCNIDSDCASGQTCNAVSGFCEQATSNIASDTVNSISSAVGRLETWIAGGVTAAGPQVKISPGHTSPVATSAHKIFTATGIITAGILGAIGYGGYRYYRKHKAK